VLLDLGEERDDSVATLGCQVPVEGPGVVARRERDVQGFVERVDA
jgi:hypothetical protein